VVFSKSLLRKLKRGKNHNHSVEEPSGVSNDDLEDDMMMRNSLKRLDPPRILITPSPEEMTPHNYSKLLKVQNNDPTVWREPLHKGMRVSNS
jgi:hypothetical protein